MNKEEKRISRYISLQAIYAYEVSGDQEILIYKQNNTNARMLLFASIIYLPLLLLLIIFDN